MTLTDFENKGKITIMHDFHDSFTIYKKNPSFWVTKVKRH